MRPAVLLVLLSSLLAVGFGYPADGDKGSDNRVGFERPITETPPQVSECGLDSLLGEVFGTSGNSDCKSGGGNNPPPNGEQGGGGYIPEPQPDPVPLPNPIPSPEGCTCVQYYLCNDNNTINEDGVGLIDIRYVKFGLIILITIYLKRN